MTETLDPRWPARFACLTDVGRVRDHNEDAYAAVPELGLWLVADGMGGASSGEVASAIASVAIPAAVRRGASLIDAVSASHQAILDGVAKGRGGAGMGSTVVALRLHDDCCEIVWVGDSRAYVLAEQGLRQLSTDHSYVQTLVDRGVLTAERARVDPSRSMLTRALGGPEQGRVKADRVICALDHASRFLLCSDGLTEELNDAEIGEILRQAEGPQAAVQALVSTALGQGGRDNITAIVIEPRAR
jgi:protein phosphatase